MKLSIRLRLAAVVLLSLLPVLLLGHLFVSQSQKEINFAFKELKGTTYLDAIAPDMRALAASAPMPASKEFAQVGEMLDPEIGSGPLSEAYFAIRPGSNEPAYSSAVSTALLSLVAKIGDGSNLILDPDLDSYYVMDIQVIKLPGVLDAGAALLDRVVRAGRSPTQDERIAILASAGTFSGLATGVQSSFASAVAGNVDGLVDRNLREHVEKAVSSAEAFSRAI